MGSLRELFHMRIAGGCDSATGGSEEPRLRQRKIASNHIVPQSAADEGLGPPSCHRSAAGTRIVSV